MNLKELEILALYYSKPEKKEDMKEVFAQFRTDSGDLFDMPFPGANKATYIILKELRRRVLG